MFQELQSKLQTRVQGLNANFTDGAARLRQQLMQNAPTGGAPPPSGTAGQAQPAAAAAASTATEEQQYLRLPVESAKKLRWIDRQDLNLLIELHLREKQELYQANSSLREVLRRQGVGEAQLAAQVAAANAAIDTMHAHDAGIGEVLVLSARAEVERLRDQVSGLTAQLEAAQHQMAALSTASSSRHRLQQRSPSSQSAASTPVKKSSGVKGDADAIGGPEEEVAGAAVADGAVSAAVAALLDALQQDDSSAGNVELDSGLLNDAALQLQRLARRAVCTAPEGEDDASAGSGSQWAVLEDQNAKLSASLAAAQQEASVAKEAGERQAAELRNRFAEAQQAQRDLLRVAQDGRLQAESRCEAAEDRAAAAAARAAHAEAEAKRLALEAKRFQEEAAAAGTRAAQLEAAAQRERSRASQQADASMQQALAVQRTRIAELEAQAVAAAQQLAVARSQAHAFEARLASAESAAMRASAELQDLEAAAAERDDLACRLVASQARVEEYRSKQLAAQGLRDLAQQSEERRARAEEELVATAKLAAELEARLTAATAEVEAARAEAQVAVMAAQAAQGAVEQQVMERWVAAGANRALWPPIAQQEVENLEARLAALGVARKATEAQLQELAAARESALQAQAAAELRAAVAQEASDRVRREAEHREQRLQAAAAAATLQVDEFRSALQRLERERDALMGEKEAKDRAAGAAAAALAAVKRRTGSGSLGDEVQLQLPAVSTMPVRNGSVAASPALRTPLQLRDTLDATDVLYLKNVILKFVDAQLGGRGGECDVLLPAVATLLRATPAEYRLLKESLQRAQQPLGWLYPQPQAGK